MFGRVPRIPIDNELNLPTQYESATPDKYVQSLLNRLDAAFAKARESIGRDAAHRKAYFDRNHRCHKIEEGDIVLVRKNKLDPNYKISDKWEDEPCEVVRQYKDFPVYIIKPIDAPASKERVLHRNMLHPARSAMMEEDHHLEGEKVVDTDRDHVEHIEDPNQVENQGMEFLAHANALMDLHFS